MVKEQKGPYGGVRLAKIRKEAEDKGIEGFADLDRAGLIAALAPKEEVPVEVEEEEVKEEKVEINVVPEEEDKPAPEPEPAAPTEPIPATPVVTMEQPSAPTGSKAEVMKKTLAGQPKVSIIIPLGPGEKVGVGITESVILNGYRLNIRKGVYTEVPKQVADILMESNQQTTEALAHPKQLDGNEPELN